MPQGTVTKTPAFDLFKKTAAGVTIAKTVVEKVVPAMKEGYNTVQDYVNETYYEAENRIKDIYGIPR